MGQSEGDVVKSKPKEFSTSQYDILSFCLLSMDGGLFECSVTKVPFTRTISWAHRKRLHHIFFVAVVGGIVEPAVWNESVWVAEVLLGCVGTVMIHRDYRLLK